MRNRILKRLGLLAAVAAAGFVLLIWTKPGAQVSKETFEMIKGGMSEEQVVEILKGPGSEAIYWRVGKTSAITFVSYGDAISQAGEWKEWASNGEAIAVAFEDGQVRRVAYFKYSESVFDKIRRWVRVVRLG
jgi:hypothetical protein